MFTKKDHQVLNNLAKEKTLHITRPDKGRGVVLMNKTDYTDKLKRILSDDTKFRRTSDDPYKLSLKLEDKANRVFRNLFKQNKIDETSFKSMYSSGSSPGIMYGLPKVHKPDLPIRPIVSSYCTHNYNLCKFLLTPLQELAGNIYTVVNSYDFVDSIRNVQNSSNKFMCSLDVTSLFTNVPVKETLEIIVRHFYGGTVNGFQNFTEVELRKLLEIALFDCYFIFDNELYQQVDGVSMGSPISPVLANIFLCDFEKRFLDTCPAEFRPSFYKRYVDDTFIVFDTEEQADHFLEYINNCHPNIHFTIEKEEEKSIPFLDILIHRSHNNFTTQVYRKSTFTGLGTNYLSSTPSRYKLNSIRTLIHRAYKISSSFVFFHNDMQFLRSFFKNNCFPVHLFERFLRNFFNDIFQPKPTTLSAPKKDIFMSLPFVDYRSKALEQEIVNLLARYFPQLKCTVAFKNPFTIGSYFRCKEGLKDTLRSGIVYLYECDRCNSSYVGSTAVQLTIRRCQHAGVSHRTFQPLNVKSQSSIRDHCENSTRNCSFKPSNFKIIDSYSGRCSDLRVLESLHIVSLNPSMNDTNSAAPLYIAR
jgi:hypothetical protein